MSFISTSSETWEGNPISRGGSPQLFANKNAFDSELQSSETLLTLVAKKWFPLSPLQTVRDWEMPGCLEILLTETGPKQDTCTLNKDWQE